VSVVNKFNEVGMIKLFLNGHVILAATLRTTRMKNPRYDHYSDSNHNEQKTPGLSPHDAPPGLGEPILVSKRGADTSNLNSSGTLQEIVFQCNDHVYTDQRRKHSRKGDYVTADPVIFIRNEDLVYVLPTPVFVASGSQMAHTPRPGNSNPAQPRTSPRVMTTVANMEQGQPQARHFGKNSMSVAKDEISDELPAPRDARRNKVVGHGENNRDDVSDVSKRSRTRSLIDHKVEKDIFLKTLQAKRSQRKAEEDQIALEIMKIDANAGITGANDTTSLRSNRSSSSVFIHIILQVILCKIGSNSTKPS
jgi:hypothetical protein